MGIAVTSGVNANIIGQLIANVKAFFEILKRFLNVLKEAFLYSKNPAVSQDTAGQSVKKVEVQEALPPAGVIGAEPLTLVPQHFPRKPA